MRKPNGYGSVHKMKGNLRNPWRVVTPNRKTIGYCPTRKEAELLLAEFHNDCGKFDSPTVEQIYNYFIKQRSSNPNHRKMVTQVHGYILVIMLMTIYLKLKLVMFKI